MHWSPRRARISSSHPQARKLITHSHPLTSRAVDGGKQGVLERVILGGLGEIAMHLACGGEDALDAAASKRQIIGLIVLQSLTGRYRQCTQTAY